MTLHTDKERTNVKLHYLQKACVNRALSFSVPKGHRESWPLYHLRQWGRKCSGLAALSSGRDHLKDYSQYSTRRYRCFPPVYSKLEEKLPNLPTDLKYRCHQHWICPWCFVRIPVRCFRTVCRNLQGSWGWLRESGFSWSLLSGRWAVPADVAGLVKCHDRLTDFRAKLIRSVRDSPNAAALVVQNKFVPIRSEGQASSLAVDVRIVILARPDRLPVRKLSAKFPALLGDPVSHRSLSVCSDQLVSAGGFLAAYPRELLHAKPEDLSVLEFLRQESGRIRTLGSTVSNPVLRLAKQGSTPETADTPRPERPCPDSCFPPSGPPTGAKTFSPDGFSA